MVDTGCDKRSIPIAIPIPIVAWILLSTGWLLPTRETVAMRRVLVPSERLMRRRGLMVSSRPRSMSNVIYFAAILG